LSLAPVGDVRDNAGMPPDLLALFLLTGASSALTLAVVLYTGFPRPETRFTLVVTLLLVYALLILASLVLLPHAINAF
jgi:hypothetical protein